MAQTVRPFGHLEQHFGGGDLLRDVVIGMSDGLTVPFALAAGISGAIQSTNLIVTAGLAEIAAGSIAMGLGGFLSARGEAEHYERERVREWREVREVPEVEAQEVVSVLGEFGVEASEAAPVVAALRRRPESWVDFMMRFELGLSRPEPRRAITSALTIGGAYVLGGLVPLIPYMLVGSAARGLAISVVLTLAALAVFGYVKGKVAGLPGLRSAFQTVLIGGLAATVAFAIARAIA